MEGKGGGVLTGLTALSGTMDQKLIQGDGAMIIFVSVKLKEIFDKQREYAWPRPDLCPRCEQSRLCGHGFVPAYFDGFAGQIHHRRCRCPLREGSRGLNI